MKICQKFINRFMNLGLSTFDDEEIYRQICNFDLLLIVTQTIISFKSLGLFVFIEMVIDKPKIKGVIFFNFSITSLKI